MASKRKKPSHAQPGFIALIAFIAGMLFAFVIQKNSTLFTADLSLFRVEEAQTQPCHTDQDCEGPQTVCNEESICEALKKPVASCPLPEVLAYAEASGRAKYTFCTNGCFLTPQGAQCL